MDQELFEGPVGLGTHLRRRAVSRFFDGAAAWLTLKPGSRPRRVARSVLADVTERLVAHPRLADAARAVLARSPTVRRRLATAIRNERARRLGYDRSDRALTLRDRGAVDLRGEVEGVRELYDRLAGLRRQRDGEGAGL
ncbi:MAG: hypothetical protein ACREFP_26135 [Acetobacteraceae bacterium]